MHHSDTQAVAYGKNRNRKEVICCLLWKTNKPTGPSRWHCVQRWWEVLCCIATAAKQELSCGRKKAELSPSACCMVKKNEATFCSLGCRVFYPTLIYLLISKAQRSLFLATRSALGLTLQKAAYRRNLFDNGLFVCSSHFPICSFSLPSACLQAHFCALLLFKKQSWFIYFNNKCLLHVTKKSVYKVWQY